MNMNDLMKRLSDLDITPVAEAAKAVSKTAKSVKKEGAVDGAHGEETTSPIHGENMNEKDLSLESLKFLSGINKTLAECGMETMSPMGQHPKTPASFSINASAESGDEVADMLKKIMTLAGVQPVGPEHMPEEPMGTMSVIDGDQEMSEPEMHEPAMQEPEMHAPGSEPSMHDMMAMFDEIETSDDTLNQEEMGDDVAVDGHGAHVNAMADEVRDMAAQLAATDKESLGLEDADEMDESAKDRPYANSPDEEIGQDGVEQFGDINNNFQNALVGQNKKTTESIANKLFADYNKFVNEGVYDRMAARSVPVDPAAAAPSRDTMIMQLRKLESEFDPSYQYSDDHSFWKHQDGLKDQIATLKHRLAKSVTEGVADAIKSGAKKVAGKIGKAIVGPGDEELLRDLQKKAGVPAHAQHGKPNMAKPTDMAEAEKPSAGMTKGSVDFDKVLEAIAALYGDDIWENDAMQDLANDLEQAGPTDRELDFIITKGRLPMRLANTQFTNNDPVQRERVREGKPSAGMTAKEKSAVAKKAVTGKDIGKPGKGFEKVAAKASKEYGSKEKGQKVAAAAMWKNAAKK